MKTSAVLRRDSHSRSRWLAHAAPVLLGLFMAAGAHAEAPSVGAAGQFSAKVKSAPVAANDPAPARAGKPVLVDAIVAVVNNEVITRRDLEDRMKMVEQRMKAQGLAMPPEDQFRKQLLERMIVDKAQLQLAREQGITVDDLILDRAIARIADQNRMSIQQLRNQLEKEGTSFASFREGVREEIIMQRLREREVDDKIQVSDAEVDAFLAENGADQKAVPELDIAQILIRIPENASAEQIAERRKRADTVVQQLSGGGDFAKLAATYSDATDALKGGDMGWRSQERLPQLFVDAVARRNPGDIALVKSANGFHILKLLGRRDAQVSKSSPALPPVTMTHVRHILIKVNQVTTAADAKHKLMELKERLKNKAATFEDLAKLYSNDLSASKGGDIGWVYPGDTVPEFERAMNALKPGEISDPVETPFGYHLIQVIARKTDDMSKERQRTAARQVLRDRKLEEATENWLRELRDRAYVEYRNDDQANG